MTAQKKETAEQKLLKMIEASQSEGGKSVQKARKTRKKKVSGSFIQLINILLVVGVIIVVCLLVLEIKNGVAMVSQPVVLDDVDLVSRRDKNDSAMAGVIQNVQYYLASINKRNIFLPYEEQIKEKAKVDTATDLSRKTKNLRLVGISWLDRVDTASAMIEDMDQQTTHFLKKGEKLNNVEVKTIYADSVELSYQNEEMILRYDKPQL